MKNRYVVAQLDFGPGETAPDGGAIKLRDLDALLRSAHEELFGVAGVAQLAWGLSVRHYCAVTQLLLIRCPRESAPALEATLGVITRIAGRPVAVHSLATYGTTRTCIDSLPHYIVAALLVLTGGDIAHLDSALLRGPAGAFDAALDASGALLRASEALVARARRREVSAE